MLLPSLRARAGFAVALAVLAGCRDSDGAGRGDAARSPSETGDAKASSVAAASANEPTIAQSGVPRAGERPALLIGATTIWLDSTSMASVGATLGAREIVDVMDVHERLLRACYTVGAGGDRLTIRLVGSAEIDESATRREAMAAIRVWNAVVARGDDGFDSPASPVACVPLPIPPSEIRWWNGLRLGMSRTEAERLLGPSRNADNTGTRLYRYSDDKLPVRRVDPATGRSREVRVSVAYGIDVDYEGDVVTRIDTKYSVSNESTNRAH